MLSLIAALAQNRTIGIDNTLPWHLPDDLRYFKATTLGKPIIMGRKTYESIGRPLPGRQNIVVTRNPNWQANGVTVAHSLDEVLRQLGETPEQEAFIIGGATLYQEALAYADALYLTEIHQAFDGDAHFPVWSRDEFVERQRDDRQGEAFSYSFVIYDRKR